MAIHLCILDANACPANACCDDAGERSLPRDRSNHISAIFCTLLDDVRRRYLAAEHFLEHDARLFAAATFAPGRVGARGCSHLLALAAAHALGADNRRGDRARIHEAAVARVSRYLRTDRALLLSDQCCRRHGQDLNSGALPTATARLDSARAARRPSQGPVVSATANDARAPRVW